ncbi:hypothetical protein CDAR_267211 [Caerostris darwini]|uniref:Uncharacterized protein n=1 Tax=Caerostris darwini TaxID=1538125 RepID=A0AAV4THV3_9ARAC|nr:hypothetical protein CDAR_267211 [Caerostris darwini]
MGKHSQSLLQRYHGVWKSAFLLVKTFDFTGKGVIKFFCEEYIPCKKRKKCLVMGLMQILGDLKTRFRRKAYAMLLLEKYIAY